MVMKKLFWEWSGEKINETSNKLYGFERARVKNYFPITVNKDYVAADISALKFDKTIEGAGFLKERVTSNNPIILDNILVTKRFADIFNNADVFQYFTSVQMPASMTVQ